MYAGGLRECQAPRSQAPGVLPDTRAECRGRIDEALMAALIASQAAAAMAAGLVSPAPLVVETVPAAQGTQRVPAATTRSKAPNKSAPALHRSPGRASSTRPRA
jgi:hypothetical protein